MNWEGIIIMMLSIVLVSSLAGFCVYRILKGEAE